MTTSDSDHFNFIQQINATTHNKTVMFTKLEKHVSHSLAFGCHFMISSTKRQTKKTCHYIASIIQYHMTLILTNSIQLQLGFSPKLDPL